VTEKEQRVEEYNQMIDEVKVVIQGWRARGMDGPTILARFFQMAVDSMEASGIDYDIVKAVVDSRYGRNNMLRPSAKA
jgi:hypothetical protein